jgi:hypothetical protein
MNCVECDKLEDDSTFCFYNDERMNGPAYWSDKGVLCSAKCATDHYLKRLAAGEVMAPSPRPRQLDEDRLF